MNVASLEFLLGLFALGAAFFLLAGHLSRRCALFVLNLAVLYLANPAPLSWILLGVFLVTGYGTALWARARSAKGAVALYLAVFTLVFVILKRYDFLLPLLPGLILEHPILITGLSYIFFRQVHFIVDAIQGQIENPSFWTYLNYQLNFFCLLSGPIQRYQDFASYWVAPEPPPASREEVLRAFLRILMGVGKVTVLAAALLMAYDRMGEWRLTWLSQANAAPLPVTLAWFLGMLYAYPLYVYLNFAGYCDIVIGGAFLIGMRLPENFDRPYLSRNLIDFWTRWHRTLGFWVRDYIFTPLYMALAKRSPQAASRWAFACYFVAFFLVGMWHGSNLKIVVFALLHGIGVSAAKLWEAWLLKRGGRAGLRKYLESRPIRALAVFLTLHYFVFTVLFFPTHLAAEATPLHALLAWLQW
ncbi:MAG: hypothetical protein GHCLOJNM_00355 [bacterium]|nr:hypothetical protein [bacterium]